MQHQSPSREARLSTTGHLLSLGSPQRRSHTPRAFSNPGAHTRNSSRVPRDPMSLYYNGRNATDHQAQLHDISAFSPRQGSATTGPTSPSHGNHIGGREDLNTPGTFGNRLFSGGPHIPSFYATDDSVSFTSSPTTSTGFAPASQEAPRTGAGLASTAARTIHESATSSAEF